MNNINSNLKLDKDNLYNNCNNNVFNNSSNTEINLELSTNQILMKMRKMLKI